MMKADFFISIVTPLLSRGTFTLQLRERSRTMKSASNEDLKVYQRQIQAVCCNQS